MEDSMRKRQLRIAPGQSIPVPLDLNLLDSKASSAVIRISYWAEGETESKKDESIDFTVSFRHSPLYAAHKVTHPHPSGIISYSILRPPSKNATCSLGVTNAPVALLLHGAGVEADSDIVKKAFDPVPDLCAWVLLPSGVTTWSSDDWHTWGFLDVIDAVYYIQIWLQNHSWKGVGVDISKLLVIGHSNGGKFLHSSLGLKRILTDM